MFNKNKQQYNA